MKRYAEFHLRLLQAELDEEREQARVRLLGWGRERLAREGAALFGLSATEKGRLYADRVVRLDLRGAALPFHRFAAGDLVSISPTQSDGPPPPPRALADGAPRAARARAQRGGSAVANAARLGDDRFDAAALPPDVETISGVVLSRSPRFVDVCVRAASSADAAVVRELGAPSARGRWRLDSAMSAIPFDRMALALASFTEPDADDALREFVLGTFVAAIEAPSAPRAPLAPPALGAALRPARAVLSEACARASLDQAQRAAVGASFGRQLSLVQGPPGTGKTRTACAIALATALAVGGGRLGRSLLAAPSNVAADNLLAGCLALGLRCVRLGRPAYARADLREHTLDALVAPPAGPTDERAHREHMARRWRALEHAQVVVATATGAGELLTGPMAAIDDPAAPHRVRFDLCLVDESSQCIEPAVLLALLSAQRAPRLVLVGDQCQLGPVLLSRRSADEARDAGGPSLFSRLVEHGCCPELLSVQYRMPEALAAFSARRYYAGRLTTACSPDERPRPPLVGALRWPHASLPLAFIDSRAAEADLRYHEQRRAADTRGTAEAACALGEADADADAEQAGGPTLRAGAPPSSSTSYCNPCEAAIVAQAVRALLAGGLDAADVGVITPYAAQVRAIADELGRLGAAGGAVEVCSVDGFQGREKEAIVLSAVRSNARNATGFLGDWRRLNVSLTRARRALIVVGDSRTLDADPHWRAFIAHVRERGGLVLWGEHAQPHAAGAAPC